MHMKVRTKIAVLLVVCTIILAALTVFYSVSEEKKLDALLGREGKDRAEGIRSTLAIAGRPLETLVSEFAHSDEMVDFILSGDRSWAKDNIDSAVDAYKASNIWVYNRAGTLMYSSGSGTGLERARPPLSAAEIAGLFESSKLAHFFITASDGVMEIRGAAVRKSSDAGRNTPSTGYLLAGRVWDKAYINNLSDLTASSIKISSPSDRKDVSLSRRDRGGVAVSSLLADWRGRPIARMNITGHSDVAGEFTRDSRRALAVIFGFAVMIAASLYLALMALISIPVNSVSLALEREDAGHIKWLMARTDEFGRLAALIDRTLKLKNKLAGELREHKRSDEKLNNKMRELEEAYAQLKDMQSKLVQSEKLAALGRFASGVAHEVKNPLSVLLGGLEYIKNKMPGADPELREALVKMREAVMRADIVVKDLLTFARPSKEAVEVVHPNTLVHDAIVFIELFKHKSDTAEINIIQDLTDKDILVEVDPAQMQQALFNVLLNAIEAMPMRGDIFVKTSDSMAPIPPDIHDKKVCVIEIRDTGSGISSEDMSRIFEPFFTTKRDRKGTGLGLCIVRSIVDKNKGVVSIHSEIDKGTIVRIILPVTARARKGVRV